MSADTCIFCRIIRGELPANKVFEDDAMLAFHDINPSAPVHLLIMPKEHVASMAELRPEHADTMGRIMTKIPELARAQGLTNGWRTIINTGRVGRQDVYHIHIHVIGGADPLGPMVVRT